jgi:beta-lactam-binding protein with PASTA domain
MGIRRTPPTEQETIVQPAAPAARRVHEEYVTEDIPPAPPRRGYDIWGWLVAALFAALAIGAIVWGLSRTDTTRVPTVVGLPLANAQAQLQAKGFAVDIIRVPRKDGNGTVLRQDPNGGAQLEKNGRVGLVTAQAATVKLPKLVGLKAEAASRLLTSLKLTPQPSVVPSDQPKGTVLSQDPAEGSRVAPGDAVSYTVAKGPNLVAVPALRGLTQAKAVAQLQALGLKPVTHQVDSPEPPNTVVAQSPAPGTKLKPGAKVDVNVSNPANSQVSVPSVVGTDQSAALATLQQLGLKADLVTVAGASAAGTIVRQDPTPDSQVAKGTTVRIYSSDGTLGNSNTTTG